MYYFPIKHRYGPYERSVLHAYNAWIYYMEDVYVKMYHKENREGLKRKFIEDEVSRYSLSALKIMTSQYECSPTAWSPDSSSCSSISIDNDNPEDIELVSCSYSSTEESDSYND